MKTLKKGLGLSIISLCVIAAGAWAQPSKNRLPANTSVNFPVQGQAEAENYLNTVTTTGPDGTHYKLAQIGDRLPKLHINNNLVKTEDLGRYASLIESLTPILLERQKAAARQNEADAIKQQDAIINEMVKDQLVKTAKDVTSFRLTVNELVVNGKAQPFSVFSRYMKKYIKDNDKVYQFNYSR
jgi:hypothetical protein